jgi:hypothetical protein
MENKYLKKMYNLDLDAKKWIEQLASKRKRKNKIMKSPS